MKCLYIFYKKVLIIVLYLKINGNSQLRTAYNNQNDELGQWLVVFWFTVYRLYHVWKLRMHYSHSL